MSCGAKFKIEVFDSEGDGESWEVDEEFRHDSEECTQCMAKGLSFSVYRFCNKTGPFGIIKFDGKISGEDFFRMYEIEEELATTIKESGTYKCRIKKVECTCDDPNLVEDNYFVYKSCDENLGPKHLDNLYFYINDDFKQNETSPSLTENEQLVFNLKSEILAAASGPEDKPPLVSPSTIALILLDEINRMDILDTLQDYWFVHQKMSYGLSQMQPRTLAGLIDSGYYKSVSGYNGDLDAHSQRKALYSEITEDKNSPALIAAYMRQSIDHWAKGTSATNSKIKAHQQPAEPGFDISEYPHVLATLYALGNHLPVHNNPGGLIGRWDDMGNVADMLYTINHKMGIPNAPSRFLDLKPLNKQGISFKCLEYVHRTSAKVDKTKSSIFTDKLGRRSVYMAPYSIMGDPMFRRTQSQCPGCY